MIVPIWLIITAVAIGCVLLLVTILALFAWKGMDLMNRELQARLKILQVDVSGLFGVDRPTRYGSQPRVADQGRGPEA